MSTDKKDNKNSHKGIFTTIKTMLERNRLGELMVRSGTLSPKDLRMALAKQKESGTHLGRVLLNENLISRTDLYKALTQQISLRCLAAMATIVISFSSLGVKPARAGAGIGDIPAQLHLVSQANAAFGKPASYQPLFGATEKRSANIAPFEKWSAMFARFNAGMNDPQSQHVMNIWKKDLARFEGMPLEQMADRVNNLINQTKYIVDSRNWGKTDYWETPIEFFQRGGDCEDFAITKYVSMRALGVPEERLRVAIVHDNVKDIPHAVLVVYTDHDALILDNQNDEVVSSASTNRYRPLFSINRTAWWLHSAPESTTVVASAGR